MRMKVLSSVFLMLAAVLLLQACAAVEGLVGAPAVKVVATPGHAYTLHPGDQLEVTVWKEKDLQRQVLVGPGGGISFPLVGHLKAAGKTVVELQKELTAKLQKYIPDPAVTVALKQTAGNVVYVIGQVNKPGAFMVSGPLDVMQALSRAGGMTAFASKNDIRILRREGGRQVALPFEYGDVVKGKDLDQNIPLHAGDVVVVP
jgi:polysaccharide export outer membrane protein